MPDTPHPGEIKEKRCAHYDDPITGPPYILWLDGSRINTGICCSRHHSQTRAIRLLTDQIRELRKKLRDIEGDAK
jgi:hypothetical protein